MSGTPLLSPLPVADTGHAETAVPLDADFDARWAAWAKRGHAHEQLVRRKLIVLAGVLATGMAIVRALMD